MLIGFQTIKDITTAGIAVACLSLAALRPRLPEPLVIAAAALVGFLLAPPVS